jgi:3-phenylpropionate/trans-cinnamate dioxygenase ferredoxin component
MTYQRVAALDDVPVGGTLRVELAEPVCLVRLEGETVKAVHDVCSHEEYSLCEGWVDDNEIECALHGSTFDLDTGEPDSLPAVDPIPVYACRVTDGAVWVDLEEQRNDATAPRH